MTLVLFSHSWDDHMALLHTILTKLQDNEFSVNPLTCEWAVKETEWVGYHPMLLDAELHVHTDHKNILSIGD